MHSGNRWAPVVLAAAVLVVSFLFSKPSVDTGTILYRAEALEVTQSQQADPRNPTSNMTDDCDSVEDDVDQLIAKRRTAVRLYVTDDAAPEILEGYLVVKKDGVQVWEGRSRNTIHTLELPSDVCDINREAWYKTFNFEVPYKKMTIGNFEFKAYVIPIGENPFANTNTPSITRTATVINRRAPIIVGVPINYQYFRPEVNIGTPEPDLINGESGVEDLLWAAWPVAEPNGYKRYHFDPRPHNVDYEVNVVTAEPPAPPGELVWIGVDQMLDELEIIRRMGRPSLENPRADWIIGWVRGGNAFGLGGATQPFTTGGAAGFAGTDSEMIGHVMAHEFGHALGGLLHNDQQGLSIKIEEVGWDVFNSMSNGRPKNKSLDSIMMSGTADEDVVWAHLQHIRDFTALSGLSLAPGWPPMTPTPTAVPSAQSRNLLTRWARSSGNGTWEFEYSVEVEKPAIPILSNTDLDFPGELKIKNSGGSVLYSTRVKNPQIAPLGGSEVDANDVVVETPNISTMHTVELYWGGVLQDVITRTSQAPTITIRSPSNSSTLTESTTVEWTVSDGDSSAITSFLVYSPDGGDRVIPLAQGLTGEYHSVTVDTSLLPGSDNASFEVVASDGVNIVREMATSLEVPDDKSPKAKISSPQSGSTYRAAVMPILVAFALDPEDGELAESSLVWSSSLDGTLGTGSELETALSVGTHTITLTVTDSASQTTTDTVTIVVQ